jgi:hypothetical protein
MKGDTSPIVPRPKIRLLEKNSREQHDRQCEPRHAGSVVGQGVIPVSGIR